MRRHAAPPPPKADPLCPNCGCCSVRMCQFAREQATTCAEVQPIFASLTAACPCPTRIDDQPPMLMLVENADGTQGFEPIPDRSD